MRSRVVVIILLPIIILLWIIGWSLFWIGSQKKPQKTQDKTERDGIGITTHVYKEYETMTKILSLLLRGKAESTACRLGEADS